MRRKRPNDLDLLIPFYANGTLDEFTSFRVAEYVAGSDAAREDLAVCRTLRKEVRILESEEPLDADWGAVWDQIEREISPVRQLPPARTRERVSWPLARVAPWAVAAALFVAVIGTDTAWRSGALPRAGEDAFRPAGEHRSGEIMVQFSAGATSYEIHELLRGLQLSVVDGPSAAGVYQLRLADGDADSASVERAVDALRTHEIVSHASAF